MAEKWETLSSELAIEHPFLRVTMDAVMLPDGQVIEEWPTIHTGDYVNMLVVNGEGDALIIEGYKHGTGKSTWQSSAVILKKMKTRSLPHSANFWKRLG